MAKLEGLKFRPGKYERAGIRECEAYNASIFPEDEPEEVPTEKPEIDSEPVIFGKDPNNQRFVFRANRVRGRRRLTRLPEKHAKNYQAVTGQGVEYKPSFYEKTITGRRGHQINVLRPIIPTHILKAPAVSDTDFPEQELQPEAQPEGKSSLDELELKELPRNVFLGTNGQFPAAELMKKESLLALERLGNK